MSSAFNETSQASIRLPRVWGEGTKTCSFQLQPVWTSCTQFKHTSTTSYLLECLSLTAWYLCHPHWTHSTLHLVLTGWNWLLLLLGWIGLNRLHPVWTACQFSWGSRRSCRVDLSVIASEDDRSNLHPVQAKQGKKKNQITVIALLGYVRSTWSSTVFKRELCLEFLKS